MRARRSLLIACLSVSSLLAACGSAGPTSAPSSQPSATVAPTPRITPEPSLPPDTSTPAVTPSREEAYQQLLVSIPPDIAAKCDPLPASVEMEPGQLAEADCDLPSGSLADYVTYSLYADQASMDDFFNTQRKGHENGGTATGPGCGKGPGEGTWDQGRKDCYLFLTDDSHVMWTHDRLYIEASAFRDDGDFAKLEQFWKTAGPVTP